MDNLNPNFKKFDISGDLFSKGDYTLPIKCEIWDWESNGKKLMMLWYESR